MTTGTKTTAVTNHARLGWLIKTALLGAIAAVLMYVEIKFPFLPPWLKLDFSDLPALLAGFSLGPVSGVVAEALKVLLFFLMKGSDSGMVGELGNFLMGAAFVLPAALIYARNKCKKNAIIGALVGIVCMTVMSGITNYWLLIPAYSKMMPLEVIISMCTAITPAANSVAAYVFIFAMPLTFVKSLLVSIIMFLIYKRLSPILHK